MVLDSDPLSLVFVLISVFSRRVIFTVVSNLSSCPHLQQVIAQLSELHISRALLALALCRSSPGNLEPGYPGYCFPTPVCPGSCGSIQDGGKVLCHPGDSIPLSCPKSCPWCWPQPAFGLRGPSLSLPVPDHELIQ